MTKAYCTIEDQIQKLRSRGMIITQKEEAKKLINYGNYFVIINGYKELFIDKTCTGADERYKNGTNFEEIYSLYSFDRELRALYLKYILILENAIKSIIARVFSEKYGHDDFLRIANFDTSVAHNQRVKPEEKVSDIVKLISTIQLEISQQLHKGNSMIIHYQFDHGHIPLWVLVNILSLGTMSKFYSYMHQTDQNDVGKNFGLHPHEMQSCLKLLTLFRNVCAHDNRLYNYHTYNRLIQMPIHNKLKLVNGKSGNFLCGQNDLFALTIIFKVMLPTEDFSFFFLGLNDSIAQLSNKIHTISIDDVLQSMGFPSNWAVINAI